MENRKERLKIMKTKFKEFAQLDPSIKETIDKIDAYPDTISIRKSKNYINNILVSSNLCKFYKEYYKYNDVTVRKLPVPQTIYDLEDIFLNIDLQLNKKENALVVSFFSYLKEYLVYINYFPYIQEYRDKDNQRFFNNTLFPYLRELFDRNASFEEFYDNEKSLVRHNIETMDSFNEIRDIVKTTY